jgi:hypothetical protein
VSFAWFGPVPPGPQDFGIVQVYLYKILDVEQNFHVTDFHTSSDKC